MAQPSDQQLVTALLDATSTMSTRERQRATGLSHFTFSRWQQGPPRGSRWHLRGETRAKILAYLERVGKLPERALDAPIPDAERQRLIGLLEEALRMLKVG